MGTVLDSVRFQIAAVAVVLVAAAGVVGIGVRHRLLLGPDTVDCSRYKCVALTFDDGPTPFTDRLLQTLTDRGAKATFFLIGNKVAADPAAARRIAAAGMEVANHTWEHPNMATIPTADIGAQLSKGVEAIAAATGIAPHLYRPAGGVSNAAVRAEAGRQHLAEILWDVIPFDWINDADTAATVYMLKTQIKPGSVVLLHDTYSSTVDIVYQFLPVLIANGYHMVTVSHLLGDRAPGTSYGAAKTVRPSTTFTTFRPPRSLFCRPRPHPNQHPICRSPTSQAKTPAGPNDRGVNQLIRQSSWLLAAAGRAPGRHQGVRTGVLTGVLGFAALAG